MDVKVIFSTGGKFNKNDQQKYADDETLYSAKKIAEALQTAGHNADLVEVKPNQINGIKEIESDVIFNLCEWSGRDSSLGIKVLKVLEKHKKVYTGADSKSYDWSCNKVMMKTMFDQAGILTPKWISLNPTDTDEAILDKIDSIPFPIIVKPAYEHCAIGIDKTSVIQNSKSATVKIRDLLNAYKQPVIAEEFIEGREFTITILKNGTLHFFPPAEVLFNEKVEKFLSFSNKWSDEIETVSSIPLSDGNLTKLLEKTCTNAFQKMGCRSYVRIDTRVRNGEVYILEINVNPDLHPDPTYGLTVSTEAVGWDFVRLVDEITNAALTTSGTLQN